MPDVRRSELLYRGVIDIGSTQINGDLRTDGHLYAVFDGGTPVVYLIDPTLGFADGAMTITGTPPNEVTGARVTWRVPQQEAFSFKLENVTVKHSSKPDLKGATVEMSQFRTRVTVKSKGIDLSLMGAKVEMRGGKRVIVDGGDLYTLESAGGCGCGSK